MADLQGFRRIVRGGAALLERTPARALLPAGRRSVNDLIARSEEAFQADNWQAGADLIAKAIKSDEAAVPARSFVRLIKAQRRRGDLLAAESTGVIAARRHSDSLPIELELARVAVARESWDEASERFTDILDRFPSGIPKDAYVDFVRAFRRGGQIEPGFAVLEKALKAHPDDATLGAERQALEARRAASGIAEIIADAEQDLAAHNWQGVVDRLEPKLETDGSRRPQLIVVLAKAYRRMDALDEAERVLKKGLQWHPSQVTLGSEAAMLAAARGDWRGAAERWTRLVKRLGDDAPGSTLVGQAKALRRAGELTSALKAVELAIARFPNDGTLQRERKQILAQRWEKEVRGALAAGSYDGPVEPIIDLARSDFEAGRWNGVVRLLKPLVKAGSSTPDIYRLLEASHRRLDQPGKSAAIIAEGVAAFPDNAELATDYARAAMREREWETASERWQSVLERFADRLDKSVFLDASTTENKLGRFDRAGRATAFGRRVLPDDGAIAVEHAWNASMCVDWPAASERWAYVLKHHRAELDQHNDQRIATAGVVLIETGNVEGAIALMQEARAARGERQLFLAVEGIGLMRLRRLDEADAHWSSFWQRAAGDEVNFGKHQRLRYAKPPPETDVFTAIEPNADVPALDAERPRLCVYTCVFGDYDKLIGPVFRPPGVDFICFTDKPADIEGWDVRVVEPASANLTLESRRYKLMPHDYLAEYEYSIYVDASVLILTDIRLLYDRWLRGHDFVAWRHSERSDVFHEIEAILARLRHRPEPMVAYYRRLIEAGMPQGQGLVEATFLWRRHDNRDVRTLMAAWWAEIQNTGGRDQPPLAYLMWKTGIRPEVFPSRLGTCSYNELYSRLPHLGRPVDRQSVGVAAGPAGAAEAVGLRRKDARVASRLVFVYRAADVQTATMMRGQQLSEMARTAVPENWEVAYRDAEEPVADSVVILTRSFLKRAAPEELKTLADRGNVICVDNVDHPVDGALHEFVDVYIASSLTQYRSYLQTIDDRLVKLVGHHADVEIGVVRPPQDRVAIGYFGELVNAAHLDELAGQVDFIQTNNVTETSRDWLARLGDYNVHYAVRQGRAGDVFKPFTKGFTAARAGANIIVPIDEGDAKYYLTTDYPYLLDDHSVASARRMIDYVEESYGGPEWRRGLEIMKSVRERSSPEHIAGEIRALLASLA